MHLPGRSLQLGLLVLVVTVCPAAAQTVRFSFQAAVTGTHQLVEGGDGFLYGTTRTSAAADYSSESTIFRFDPATNGLTTILRLPWGEQIGGTLLVHGGFFYAATLGGGGCGRILRVTPASGALTEVARFSGANGCSPSGGLTEDGGILYGVASTGGPNDKGLVYRLDPATGALSTLAAFTGPNGSTPAGALRSSGGALYGATLAGGASGFGTLFKVLPATGALSTLVSFTQQTIVFGPTASAGGLLYGVTLVGGASNKGSIYTINPATDAVSTAASFSGLDGMAPSEGLASDGATVYGATRSGGASGCGAFFKLVGGVLSVVGSWACPSREPTGVMFSGGQMYAATSTGWMNGGGVVRIDLVTGAITSLGNFSADLRGFSPQGQLARDGAFLFGTTRFGSHSEPGADTGCGAQFRLVPAVDIVSVEVTFGGNFGCRPSGPLLRLGWTYGSTTSGGAANRGTIFMTDGVDVFPFSFPAGSGREPTGLTSAAGGIGYGTTRLGGAADSGIIYSVNLPAIPAGPTLLGTFSGTNGARPVGVPVIDGSVVYGVTERGGANDLGAIYKLDGTLTAIASFDGSNGRTPTALALVGRVLYGATRYGGATDQGTLFKYDLTTGVLSTVASFDVQMGIEPAGLLVVSGSVLFGVTRVGGAYGGGSVYRYDTADGALVRVASLNPPTTGSFPMGGVLADGTQLWGTASSGGSGLGGTIFSVTATEISLSSSRNPATAGESVTLQATVTAGATGSVTFKAGAAVLGSSAIAGGTASLSISSLAAGAHALTAHYDGDGAEFGAGRSHALTQTVLAAPAITSFTAARTTLTTGTGTTLTPVFSGGTGAIDHGIGAVTSGTAYATGNLTAAMTFTLTVTNALGAALTRPITVSVSAPPVLGAIGAKTAAEAAPLAFTLTATDAEGDALTYAAVGLPVGATLDPATGAFAWTPPYDASPASPFTVTFTVTDAIGGSDSETITITVTNTNRSPVLAVIGARTVAEAAALSFAIGATDADGEAITYSSVGLPVGATLHATTGAFTWTPGYDASPASPYTITFAAADALGGSDSETITITVTNTNRPPVLAPIGARTVAEAATLAFTMSATDADGEPVTFSAVGLPPGAALNGTSGAFAWTPDYDASPSSPYSIAFTAIDSLGGSDEETITISVANTNRRPMLAAIGDRTVAENSVLSFTVSATDADGDSLVYNASNLPSGAAFDGTTRAFSWSPSYMQAGTYGNVTFTVSDGTDATAEAITISVTNVNRAPVLAAIGDRTVAENATLSFIVSATDGDGQTLAYGAMNLPSGANFNTATREFSWTPSYTQAGRYSNVAFTVSDGVDSISEAITVTVTNTNRAPVLVPIGSRSVMVGFALSFTIDASDPDGESVYYAASDVPPGASFETATRSFSWTPAPVQTGSYAVTFSATDGHSTASETVTITVTGRTATTTSITSSANPSTVGDAVALTATVTTGATGAVAFRTATTLLGSVTLTGGTAVLTMSTLPAGSHAIVAEYGGDAMYAESRSTVLSQVVTELDVMTLPVGGSTPGAFGSYFKTSMQMHNGGLRRATGTILFRPQGSVASAFARRTALGEPSLPFSLEPGVTLAIDDLVSKMGFSGLGSIDVVGRDLANVLVNARVYNDSGERGTTGLGLACSTAHTALRAGDRALLIAPANVGVFRFNVGVRTFGEGATIEARLDSADGIVKQVTRRTYGPNHFEQQPVAAFTAGTLAANDTITVTVERGSLIVYGSMTDNRTQDPTYQEARSVAAQQKLMAATRLTLPVAGSAAGGFGSFFKTALQLHNAGTSAIAGRVVFHPQANPATESDPSLAFTVGAGQTRSYDDVIAAIGTSGIGSLDLMAADYVNLFITARIYNDAGENGTTGAGIDVVDEQSALRTGERAIVIAPANMESFRLNIGVRTLDKAASIQVTLLNAEGTVKRTITREYAAEWFEQVTAGQFAGAAIQANDAIVVNVSSGSLIVYGSMTDNRTQDPTYMPARRRN